LEFWRRRKKVLFFETKKQNTFASSDEVLEKGLRQLNKSFLVLFFKKEHFAFKS